MPRSSETVAALASALAKAQAELVNPVKSLTASIRNLFDQHYSDPGSDEHVFDSIQQTGRTVRVGLRWTIRAR